MPSTLDLLIFGGSAFLGYQIYRYSKDTGSTNAGDIGACLLEKAESSC